MNGRRMPLHGFSRVSAGSFTCALVALAGCGGGGDDYANDPRPPSPINVSAQISERGISVSPKTFGAGPIVLIISNQTSESQQITLETDDATTASTPGITQSTGPINPGGTAQIKVDVQQGTYNLGVDANGVRPASIRVGEPRESAQNELLQP